MTTRRGGPRRRRAQHAGGIGWRLREWGWGIAAGLALLAIGGGTIFAVTQSSGGGAQAIDGVVCESTERLEYHVHAHLAIYVNGDQVAVPASVGLSNQCIYWLHTHDASGLIHIEAPSQQGFTLAQFFAVWGQTLSAGQLMSYKTDSGHQIQAYVNGQPWTGDPAAIPLDAHAVIVLEYGPPFPAPQPFAFPSGL